MKLHTMNLGGNLHTVCSYLNKMGLAKYVVALDCHEGRNTIAVLRASVHQVNKWRAEQNHIPETIHDDDPPASKVQRERPAPKDGAEAFASGWGVGANPWMSGTHPLEFKKWYADWHQADYEAFKSFVDDK